MRQESSQNLMGLNITAGSWAYCLLAGFHIACLEHLRRGLENVLRVLCSCFLVDHFGILIPLKRRTSKAGYGKDKVISYLPFF